MYATFRQIGLPPGVHDIIRREPTPHESCRIIRLHANIDTTGQTDCKEPTFETSSEKIMFGPRHVYSMY
jgi:hypothetical protein